MWLDVFGPSLFIFLSALSVVFSITKKKGKLPEHVVRNRIFMRGVLIMLVGTLYTLVSNLWYIPNLTLPFNLYGWNILTFIGLSQIATYYACKLSEPGRIFVGFIILLFSPSLRMGLTEMILLEQGINPDIWWVQLGINTDIEGTVPPLIKSNADLNSFASIMYFILFSPTPHTPPFPWVSICLISSIWGEWLAEAMHKGTNRAYKDFHKRITKWGIFFVLIGITFGIELLTEDTARLEYLDVGLYTIANWQPIIHFPGMFRFLIHGEPSNMIYLMGMALLILSIFFYLVDLKNWTNKLTDVVMYYGKVSLSLFLIHYMLYFFFPNSLDLPFFIFAIFGYWSFLGFLMYIWIEFGDGKGSPEWIIIQMGRTADKGEDKVKQVIKKLQPEHKRPPKDG